MSVKPTALPESGFIRLPIVLAVFPISRSAWWAGVKSGKYPKPVKLSERTTAWRVEDIRTLLASYGPAANDGGTQA
jgi:prophage regulatory protein